MDTQPTKPGLPRLRPGLCFSPVQCRNTICFIVEDPSRHVYYRIGGEEYLLLTHLSSSSSLEELLQKVNRESETALTPEQAATILRWLAGRQLLQMDDPRILSSVLEQEEQMRKIRRQARINLTSFKIPLGNPDPLLHKLYPRLKWLTGTGSGLLWLLAGLFALGALFAHWQEFNDNTTGFFSPTNLFILWLIWLGLKILHELFHALVCYRYGGRVYEAGILFILFIPLTYVNATSSWKFPSPWQRIHVAGAGIFAELGVAWIALLLWAYHPDSTTGLIAHRTAIIAGLSSLLFNANPLMRFDGYYILSDFMGIPNLYQLGQQDIKARFAHLFLGIKQPPVAEESHRFFVRIYGILIFFWRFLIFASLGYLASKLFGGLGVIISLAALLLWISSPLHALLARWPTFRQHNPHVLRDLLLRSLAALILTAVLLTTVGWNRIIQAPAVVEYQHQHRIKTGASGFVRKILVRDGDMVTAGRTLMILEDPAITAALRDTQLLLEQNRIKARVAHNSGRFTEVQILRRQRNALEKMLTRQQEKAEALIVKAPAPGRVIAAHLAELENTYLDKGREILWLVDAGEKQLNASISQDGINQLRTLVGKSITVDMRKQGLGRFEGRVKRITPTASTRLTHPGLAARYGGPIDVLERRVKSRNNSTGEHIQLAFFEPRFSMEIAVPENLVKRMWAGQIGSIQAAGPRLTLRQRLGKQFDKWIRKKDRAAAAR